MEGTGAPDVGAGAMDLGVIDGRDLVAVPDPTRGGGDQASQGLSDAPSVPGAVLGEGFQGLPGGGLLQGQDPDWVMVCSSTLIAMAAIDDWAKRWKPWRVKAQAKALSRACQMDQVKLRSLAKIDCPIRGQECYNGLYAEPYSTGHQSEIHQP